MELKDIQAPVVEHLRRFEPYFDSQLESPNVLLSMATRHVFRRRGKRMRPLLVFLSAAAAGGVGEPSYAAAFLIELLHNASLVHDDVVDETYSRRGQWSLMGLWGNKPAVLVGDFFLARGMEMALDGGHYELLRIVSRAVRDLADGELEQMEHARRMDMTEEAYYSVIRRKTATLIEACTRAGATSAGAGPEVVDALARYGGHLGMAFQIRDDMFDYTPGGLFGKPALNDVKEQKLTLPLIAAMREAPEGERRGLERMIRRDPKSDATALAALAMVERHGGMAYARARMEELARQAVEDIAALPDGEARRALAGLVEYNMGRKV